MCSKLFHFDSFFNSKPCLIPVGAGAFGAGTGAASRYSSGSDQKMWLLTDPAPDPQHCLRTLKSTSSLISSLQYFLKFVRKNDKAADDAPTIY
jgi:hypothetical protein